MQSCFFLKLPQRRLSNALSGLQRAARRTPQTGARILAPLNQQDLIPVQVIKTLGWKCSGSKCRDSHSCMTQSKASACGNRFQSSMLVPTRGTTGDEENQRPALPWIHLQYFCTPAAENCVILEPCAACANLCTSRRTRLQATKQEIKTRNPPRVASNAAWSGRIGEDFLLCLALKGPSYAIDAARRNTLPVPQAHWPLYSHGACYKGKDDLLRGVFTGHQPFLPPLCRRSTSSCS